MNPIEFIAELKHRAHCDRCGHDGGDPLSEAIKAALAERDEMVEKIARLEARITSEIPAASRAKE